MADKVAIARAKGDGGFQDPNTGVYISSQRDTIVPLTAWVENMANHNRVEIVETIEGSNWAEFMGYVAKAEGDEEKALEAYREFVPSEDNGVEKVTQVESPAALVTEEEDGEPKPRRGRRAAAQTEEAPAE